MESRELRIGNYVNYGVGREPQQITGHDLYQGVEGRPFNGIELSPEWLERLGFYLNVGRIFLPMNYNRGLEVDNFRVVLHEESGYTFLCNLEYVHQLQNLYFALTGTELTLKQ